MDYDGHATRLLFPVKRSWHARALTLVFAGSMESIYMRISDVRFDLRSMFAMRERLTIEFSRSILRTDKKWYNDEWSTLVAQIGGTNMKAILPLNNNIAVRRLEIKPIARASAGAGKEPPTQGTVVSVGTNRVLASESRVLPLLKAGDRVCFKSAAGGEVTVDGQLLLILAEADILAVLDAIETDPLEEDSAAKSSQVSNSSGSSLSERFLLGIGSVLEFFPSPERFDSWRLAQDMPFGAWPIAVRNEFAALQSAWKI